MGKRCRRPADGIPVLSAGPSPAEVDLSRTLSRTAELQAVLTELTMHVFGGLSAVRQRILLAGESLQL
jgi:hypothetical protein